MNFKSFDYGYLALFFAVPAFLPQVYKLYLDGDTTSFSFITVIFFWLAQLFWILHGIQKTDEMIMTGATINMLCFTYILYRLIIDKYKKNNKE